MQYDYLISADADFASIPAGLQSAGGTIGVSPGTYTAKTLTSLNPSSTLRFVATDANSKPVIDILTIDGCSNLKFEDIKIVTTAWQSNNNTSSTTAALIINGTCGELEFLRCRFAGNYRGVADDSSFNVLTEYPEYACILPVFNDSGVITSLDRYRTNVGDLVADGTYSLTFDGTVTGAAATFTVASGVITATSLTNGGTSSYTSTTGIGIRSKVISWADQRRMINWLPNAFRGGSGATVSVLKFTDSEFNLFGNVLKPAIGIADWQVVGCTFSRCYQDFFSMGFGSTPVAVTFTDNFGTLPFSDAGDPGDPHSDWVQVFMDDINSPYSQIDMDNVVIERNVFVDGNTRGYVQGTILSDCPYVSGEAKGFARWRIVGNLVASRTAGLGLQIAVPRDNYVANNAYIQYDHTDVRNFSTKFVTLGRTLDSPHPSGPFAYGQSLVKDSICESFNLYGTTASGNTTLGYQGATIPYTTVFNAPNGAKSTLAEIISAYTPKVAYAGKGPFGNTAYINHVTRTTDRSQEPAFIKWTDLTGQAVSTQVTSEWRCVVSGQDGRTISVSGGEYRIADDQNGTNATAWTSSAGTVDVWKYVQLRQTTSGSGSTTTTTTLTIGGVAFTWQATTTSSAVFTAVDNGGTAYSTIPRPTNETSLRKLLIVARFRPDVVNGNIIAHTGASQIRLWHPTTSTIRFQYQAATRASIRPGLTITAGQTRTHFIAMDFTSGTAGQGCFWATDVEGTILSNSAGSGGTFDTRSTFGSGTDYGAHAFDLTSTVGIFGSSGVLGLFNEGDGGGTFLDGAFEFLWMEAFTVDQPLPDVTSAIVRNSFSADNINLTNGSGPLGYAPRWFYTGTASEWNANLSNKGSLTAFLTKAAGTYT